MISEQAKLTNYVLESAYLALTKLNDYGHHLTLIGAYSIFRQLRSQYHEFDENSRVTKDLDFELYNSSLNETDYILFQRALRSVLGNGYGITFFPLKERSVTYTFQVEYRGIKTGRLKIDFSLVKGELLRIVTNVAKTLDVDYRWFTEEGMSLARRSGKGFNGLSQQDLFNIICWTRTLLWGLKIKT